jgi:hypothetical protein
MLFAIAPARGRRLCHGLRSNWSAESIRTLRAVPVNRRQGYRVGTSPWYVQPLPQEMLLDLVDGMPCEVLVDFGDDAILHIDVERTTHLRAPAGTRGARVFLEDFRIAVTDLLDNPNRSMSRCSCSYQLADVTAHRLEKIEARQARRRSSDGAPGSKSPRWRYAREPRGHYVRDMIFGRHRMSK